MKRLLAAVVTIALMVFIWFAVVWNNFAIRNGLIADDYLMPVSLLALMLIVLILNPLLKTFCPGYAFSKRVLVIICGVLFMAALPPSAGILRQMVFPLGDAVRRSNTEKDMAEAYAKLSPPPSLFPDSLEYDVELPVIQPFVDELSEGESVPWGAWVKPIMGWSGFILPWYLMMLALSVIMTRYWRDAERTPFPLAAVFRALIDVPEKGRSRVPAIFKSKLFWSACGVVFLLHAFGQAHKYFPSNIPSFPLSWSLWGCFSEEPWRYMPWWFKSGRIYFTFLGLAFFLPNRISFSLWFMQVACAFFIMFSVMYMPPFQGRVLADARAGSLLVFSLFVAWLARAHLLHVLRCMGRRCSDKADRAYSIAGWAFAAGCFGMFAWFLWVKVPTGYAAVFVAASVIVALALMRVVAETGMPLFFFSTDMFVNFLKLLPLSLRTLPAMYFGSIFSMWIGSGQRVCIGAASAQVLSLDEDEGVSRHVRIGALFMVVLVLSVVGGWLVILLMNYHNSYTADGRTIAWWGRQQFRPAEDLMLATLRGSSPDLLADHLPAFLNGSVLALAFYSLCQLFPGWPMHPIGLLGVGTWCVSVIWPSILIGWLLKNLLIRYGGSSLYSKAKDAFIGLVMGEVFAVLFWSGIAAAMALAGRDYFSVNILPY